MRTAIVGCGRVSRDHVAALRDLAGVDLCAVADRDPRRSEELARLLPGARCYTDAQEMLGREQPDVVHICTPPESHADLALMAIEAGCHVLVEKPFALTATDADRMLDAAREKGVVISTCHNMLFTPAMARARQMLAEGRLGEVLNVVTFYGVSPERGYDSAGFHWAWRLPGGIFTNFLPHLISLQLACLGKATSVGDVVVRPGGEGRLPTELLVVTRSADSFGTMVVSLRSRPSVKFVEIQGTKGMLRVDLVREVCVWQRPRRAPGPVAKLLYNVDEILQLSAGTVKTTLAVATGRTRSNPGLPPLLARFYASVVGDGEPPVSADETRATVGLLLDVLAHDGVAAGTRPAGSCAPRAPVTPTEQRLVAAGVLPGRVLVTGATGFLGGHLVRALWRCGLEVRALVRDPTTVSFDLEQQAQIVVGGVDDAAAVRKGMDGVDVVYHCAAATTNALPWSVHHDDNVRGTETVLAAARQADVRVVHLSSVVVYGVGRHPGSALDESAPFASDGDRWAHYQRSKIEAEKIVLRYGHEGLPLSVVRLGILYGPGRPVRAGLLQLGPLRFTIGRARNRLPYTHVSNAVDALLLVGCSDAAVGEAFNVVDEPQRPLREVLDAHAEGRLVVAPVPPAVLLLAARVAESRRAAGEAETPPKLARFVIRSACRDVTYDTTKARTVLGWNPEPHPASDSGVSGSG